MGVSSVTCSPEFLPNPLNTDGGSLRTDAGDCSILVGIHEVGAVEPDILNRDGSVCTLDVLVDDGAIDAGTSVPF